MSCGGGSSPGSTRRDRCCRQRKHQLSDEFQIARPTVVRALRVLRQDGWIETQQGKGSFVRGRPALAGLAESPRTGEQALNRDESREPET